MGVRSPDCAGRSPTRARQQTQIRAIAAELPGPVALEDALAILLALVDREPETI